MMQSDPPRALTQAPVPELHRELTMLQESSLITAEQQRALVQASGGLQRMQATSTPVGKRHFNRIDTLLAVRAPTPVSQAREALATLGEVWDGLSGDFHRYREMYFEVKLRKAKLAKRRKEIGGLDGDDATIAEAEAHLEQARIDALEATMAKGHATLQAAMTTATAASQKYALICKAAGKEEFTDDDFLAEEVDHTLKSAFWHASQQFRETDTRDKWDRPTFVAKTRADEHALKYGGRLSDGSYTSGYKKTARIDIETEVKLYFESMGVSWPEVARELSERLASAEGSAMFKNTQAENETRYHQWLERMAVKYRPRALEQIRQHGRSRLDRVAKLLSPTDSEKGQSDIGTTNRASVIE